MHIGRRRRQSNIWGWVLEGVYENKWEQYCWQAWVKIKMDHNFLCD